MFTGIVSGVGRVQQVDKRGDTRIVIATTFDVASLEIGASIACAGICMTVVETGGSRERWFAVTASSETLSKTTIGEWNEGRDVNLERPLRVGDELGGHIVTGHIDGTAAVARVAMEGESMRLTLEPPAALLPFIAPKGSVALDGVSLTVNEAERTGFGVNLIPHTLKATTFGGVRPGARVNLEIDVLARYVARLVRD